MQWANIQNRNLSKSHYSNLFPSMFFSWSERQNGAEPLCLPTGRWCSLQRRCQNIGRRWLSVSWPDCGCQRRSEQLSKLFVSKIRQSFCCRSGAMHNFQGSPWHRTGGRHQGLNRCVFSPSALLMCRDYYLKWICDSIENTLYHYKTCTWPFVLCDSTLNHRYILPFNLEDG